VPAKVLLSWASCMARAHSCGLQHLLPNAAVVACATAVQLSIGLLLWLTADAISARVTASQSSCPHGVL
jgi:hypothetical protein